MGLKNWFAGMVAGPQLFGSTMGANAREGVNGITNMIFLSHGTQTTKGRPVILDSPDQMRAEGFTQRYDEIEAINIETLSRQELEVFQNIHRAMLAFVFILNSNAALNYMRRDNTSKFRNGFGPSFLQSAVAIQLFNTIGEARTDLLSYISSFESARLQFVLNMDKPGSGDALEHFVLRAIDLSNASLRYAFTRNGSTGFSLVARTVAEETVKSIAGAAQQYKW